MSEYLFLYRSNEEAHHASKGSPERLQQSMAKWRAWFQEMTQKGHLTNVGQPLERQGKVVTGKSKTVVDGPYAESKDIIGGYSIIEAKDLEQAARIAAGCPILEVGGMVEVRPVQPINL